MFGASMALRSARSPSSVQTTARRNSNGHLIASGWPAAHHMRRWPRRETGKTILFPVLPCPVDASRILGRKCSRSGECFTSTVRRDAARSTSPKIVGSPRDKISIFAIDCNGLFYDRRPHTFRHHSRRFYSDVRHVCSARRRRPRAHGYTTFRFSMELACWNLLRADASRSHSAGVARGGKLGRRRRN